MSERCMGTHYYFCNFSVNLKLFGNEKFLKSNFKCYLCIIEGPYRTMVKNVGFGALGL